MKTESTSAACANLERHDSRVRGERHARGQRSVPYERTAPQERDATPLLSPEALKQKHSLSEAASALVSETARRLTRRVTEGAGRPLVIVGPCSIHCETAALEYARELGRLRQDLGDKLELVMRVYFEKPRTSVGWKGFLYDPALDGSDDLPRGLERARALMVQIAELGVPMATEILDPLVVPYLEDCLSWVAVGARTSESQIHRQMASGLSCPVGFKNATDGSISVAAQAMTSAKQAHTHLGIDAYGAVSAVRTAGNPAAHLVLRGGTSGPNYCEFSVARAGEQLKQAGHRPEVLVDVSHGNSEKDFRRQGQVARAVFAQLGRRDVDVLGIMLESHLNEGRQELGPGLKYGVSVTDGCISLAETEELLREMASGFV